MYHQLIDQARMFAQNGPAIAAAGTLLVTAILVALWSQFRKEAIVAVQSTVSAEVGALHEALDVVSSDFVRQARREGFVRRQSRALEELWPRIVACDIAQRTIVSQKRQGNVDLRDAAIDLGKCRRELHAFVQAHALYLKDDTRQLVRSLDDRLADRNVDNVSADVGGLETHLRQCLDVLD